MPLRQWTLPVGPPAALLPDDVKARLGPLLHASSFYETPTNYVLAQEFVSALIAAHGWGRFRSFYGRVSKRNFFELVHEEYGAVA